MRPLRIALVAALRFPVREPFMGGLEAHTHALATELRRRGHDVCLLAAPGSDPSLDPTEVSTQGFVSTATERGDVGTSPETWMREHHAYLAMVLALARGDHGRFDVIHNNCLHHIPVAMSQVLPAPLLTTLHTPPLPFLESATQFATAGSHFVAVSEHVAAQWRHVVDAEVVLNGVPTSTWRPGPGGDRAVWFGRLVPEKAPHEAIEAARRAGIGIDLVGPAHDPAYVEERVLPLLGADAAYLGHLGTEDLREVVGRSRVAVVTPRWAEPYGLVAAEALACGTPVAAYDTGALSEVIDAATGRLASVGDVDALAAAIREAALLDRDDARARACRHLDHGRMVDGYEQAYRRLSAWERVA